MSLCLGVNDDVAFMKWRLAIAKDQDCSFTIEDPDTVATVAARYGHLGILRKMSRYNPTKEALDIAIRGGHLKLAKWLVNKYPDYGFSEPNGSDWKEINVKIVDWVANQFHWKNMTS